MESSKAFELPQVPSSESEKRLARIFCFLRQHERKTKVAKKVAELQKLRFTSSTSSSSAAHSYSPELESQQPHPHGSFQEEDRELLGQRQEDDDEEEDERKAACGSAATALFDQSSLLDELNLLTPDNNSRLKTMSKSKSSKKIEANKRAAANPRTAATAAAPPSTATAHQEKEKHDHMLALDREIREQQKGILPPNISSSSGSVEPAGWITAADLVSAMKAMNRSPTKTEVQWMIWEADDDLDGCIDWHEFKGCYARSLVDKHGLEPNQLYHFIQFLLCDTDESFIVSVLELKAELKKLPGTDHLASKLLVALKDDTEQQLLQKFTLSEYLDIMLADLPASFTIH